MQCHLFGFFLAHGPAQQIGTPQGVPAQHLGGLHHLLLVHHDAVGFGQDGLCQWMRIGHGFSPMFAGDKTGNQAHGAWSEQSVEHNQIFQARGLGVLEHGLHAAAFKLKHRFCFAIGKQLVRGCIVQWDVFI